MSHPDLSEASLLDLFRLEAQEQSQILTNGLLALERDAHAAAQLESCMRAAHSIKGAARVVGIPAGVNIAHAMENCFVAAQERRITLRQAHMDELLRAVDLIRRIAQTSEADISMWDAGSKEITAPVAALARIVSDPDGVAAARPADVPEAAAPAPAPVAVTTIEKRVASPPSSDAEASSAVSAPLAASNQAPSADLHDRVLRVTAENLNRLLGLAAESLVEGRWVQPFGEALQRLKRQHYELSGTLHELREELTGVHLSERAQEALANAEKRVVESRRLLSQRLSELETFDRRVTSLSHRLYEGALACRMRPFSDGTLAFPRLVRDLARQLDKKVHLDVIGSTTQVDRDVLEKLDAPLGHLLRNAVDHGIESPRERLAAGKPAEGVIRLEARHSAGRLTLQVSDDGRGIDLAKLRRAVVERRLASEQMAAELSESELYEFLLLPGFSLAGTVTEISGRGVGLDVVQHMLKRLRGTIRITAQPGRGTQFLLQLPLTLSVVRALLVEVGGEPYAIPLASIVQTIKVPTASTALLEGRSHFELGGKRVGLITAHQVLESSAAAQTMPEWSVVVLGNEERTYGLVVDRLLGERELVVQPFDARLGKIQDINAGALMEDGSPVLILDVEDAIRSIEKLVVTGALSAMTSTGHTTAKSKRKRVLVVDDSLTVRELERKLLVSGGYEVEVAVDGMDGWNAVRSGEFDLVVTDVDMPRMDGIELVTLLKQDPVAKSLPVMIVSYKDRPEDRQRGLKAGADYYLAKSGFHDQTLLSAVADLIGTAAA
ncbi:MAG TPA: hybrid sensor histidine kinase/response regulator [Steroidobacteraceae bacterium]|nr:hybrid sensor histidine kinase/response regulator [Steroidobacteraceae bacterium]